MLMCCLAGNPFIFIANTKAASTSIHRIPEIGKMCEFRIRSSKLGKHLSLSRIKFRYQFVFDVVPLERFGIIMVVRDPISWFMSWYKYRMMPDFDNHPKRSHGMTPEEFFDKVFRFEDLSQHKLLDIPNMTNQLHLLRFGERLETDLNSIAGVFNWGGPIHIPYLNKSRKPSRDEAPISLELEQKLKSCLNADFELWERVNSQN